MSSAQKRRRPLAEIAAKRDRNSTLGYLSRLHEEVKQEIYEKTLDEEIRKREALRVSETENR